jgi:hypothetical protein
LLFEKASNEQRAFAIKTLADFKEPHPDVIEHVRHLLTYFSICAENRNILMHSRHSWTVEPEDGSIALAKRLKAGGKNVYQLDLPTIKRVAKDMITGVTYLMQVDKFSRAPMTFDALINGEQPRPSLEKPPLPDKLNPHRPVVNLEANPSPPETSTE